MEALRIGKAADIIETALASVVGHVETYTPVYAQHEDAHIVAQAHAGAHSHLREEVAGFKLAAGAIAAVAQ